MTHFGVVIVFAGAGFYPFCYVWDVNEAASFGGVVSAWCIDLQLEVVLLIHWLGGLWKGLFES